MNKSKKLLAILLTMLMVLGMSANAFAMDKTDYTDEDYAMVTSGYLEINDDGSVSITDKYINYVKNKLTENGVNAEVLVDGNTIIIEEHSNLTTPRSLRASGGVTKVEWLSFNRFKIYLNNDLSNKVVAGTGIGAALSTWIPDVTVSKIVATALGVSSGLVAFNNKGNGVIVSGIYSLSPPLATFYWIKPQ